MKICKLTFLLVTFLMPECVYQNPDLNIIIHLDESEDISEGLPKIGRGVTLEEKQIIGLVQGKKELEHCILKPESKEDACERGLICEKLRITEPWVLYGKCKKKGKKEGENCVPHPIGKDVPCEKGLICARTIQDIAGEYWECTQTGKTEGENCVPQPGSKEGSCKDGLICAPTSKEIPGDSWECKNGNKDTCTTAEDCKGIIYDSSWICKNGQCKMSSGCGTGTGFGPIPCEVCDEDICEDEGACTWADGKCVKNKDQGGRCGKIRNEYGPIPCEGCDEDNCEDGGVCTWRDGKCAKAKVQGGRCDNFRNGFDPIICEGCDEGNCGGGVCTWRDGKCESSIPTAKRCTTAEDCGSIRNGYYKCTRGLCRGTVLL